MGSAWVPVRNGIDDETLRHGDARALELVESWERLVRQVCLRLGGELGQKVLPVQQSKRGIDPGTRRSRLADQLCLEGRLHAEVRIEGTPGLLTVIADLRTGRLRTCVEIPAPDQGYPLTWAKRLVSVTHLEPSPPPTPAPLLGTDISVLIPPPRGRLKIDTVYAVARHRCAWLTT